MYVPISPSPTIPSWLDLMIWWSMFCFDVLFSLPKTNSRKYKLNCMFLCFANQRGIRFSNSEISTYCYVVDFKQVPIAKMWKVMFSKNVKKSQPLIVSALLNAFDNLRIFIQYLTHMTAKCTTYLNVHYEMLITLSDPLKSHFCKE